ncbi:MAG: aminoglycoside phosphotransferase family protein [Bacteroidia bacterium]|nr:aminoglycoside phosphotransferase family protein [Bacteroidia bacterium]
MNDYVRTGEGANGASYDCISDGSVMVKLYNSDYPADTIFSELDVARKVFELGIPSPEPGIMVTDGERIGIRFRKVIGKRSYSRAFADEPERTEEYAREFARLCKKLHATECPEGLFPEAKPQFLRLLEASRTFSGSEKAVIADFIRNVPDAGTALHGDMHFGNALTTLPKGAPISDPHDLCFIDLGYFARGCPLFDMGMMMNICLYADEEFRFHDFHVTGKQTVEIWKYFVDEYFFGPERLAEKYFGPGRTFESVNDALKPYSAVKLFLVEYNLGFMPENYISFIRGVFGF